MSQIQYTNVRYTPVVGQKFNPDGSIHPFAGSTIICFADPASRAYQQAMSIQEQFRQTPIGSKHSFLPPDSFHMTVCELINDPFRHPSKWPEDVPLHTLLDVMDDYFIERVAQVPAPENFRMRCTGLRGRGLLITLTPADDETERAIWAYRRAIADVTGLRTPDFDNYQFHMTLAYRLIELEPDEVEQEQRFIETIGAELRESFGIFDTGKPSLTFFDDMHRFVTVDQRHTLKSRSLK